jgi:hypothetical protein
MSGVVCQVLFINIHPVSIKYSAFGVSALERQIKLKYCNFQANPASHAKKGQLNQFSYSRYARAHKLL